MATTAARCSRSTSSASGTGPVNRTALRSASQTENGRRCLNLSMACGFGLFDLFQRQQQLAKNNFTPQSSFDSARRDLQVAQQKLVSLKQQLAGVAASLNNMPDAPVEDYPKYKEMLAARGIEVSHETIRRGARSRPGVC